MRYIISYDVTARIKKNQDAIYDALREELEDELEATPILLSQWAVRKSGTTAAKIKDQLLAAIDIAGQRRSVRLLVTCLDRRSYDSFNLLDGTELDDL